MIYLLVLVDHRQPWVTDPDWEHMRLPVVQKVIVHCIVSFNQRKRTGGMLKPLDQREVGSTNAIRNNRPTRIGAAAHETVGA